MSKSYTNITNRNMTACEKKKLSETNAKRTGLGINLIKRSMVSTHISP